MLQLLPSTLTCPLVPQPTWVVLVAWVLWSQYNSTQWTWWLMAHTPWTSTHLHTREPCLVTLFQISSSIWITVIMQMGLQCWGTSQLHICLKWIMVIQSTMSLPTRPISWRVTSTVPIWILKTRIRSCLWQMNKTNPHNKNSSTANSKKCSMLLQTPRTQTGMEAHPQRNWELQGVVKWTLSGRAHRYKLDTTRIEI
jgi:hypothetical protein